MDEEERLRAWLRCIAANKGMCIYGTPELIDASREVKEAYRLGSADAFERCVRDAEAALSGEVLPKEECDG